MVEVQGAEGLRIMRHETQSPDGRLEMEPVGVIGLEPTTSASQTPRASTCATPRYARSL
jgi:hypothetical protein